ncbi:MAG: hypothetical protein ABJA87_01425 [bacterium]
MNDEDLDHELRSWAAVALEQAPPVSVPAPPERGDRRARVLAMVAAAALVVGLTGVGLLLARSSDRASSADGLSSGPVPTAPAGFLPITVHGLTINVPAAWADAHSVCGPITNEVLVPSDALVPACGALRPPGITTVEFRRSASVYPESRPMTIDGRGAERWDELATGVYSTTIGVPSLVVSVVISAPTRAVVDRLLGTLRVTGVDTNGCPARITGFQELKTGARRQRPGADHALIPPTPIRLVGCRFHDGWLEGSSYTVPTESAVLTRTLSAQPGGLSVTAPQKYEPAGCGADDPQDAASYRVEARYEQGPPVLVNVRLGRCGRLGASNGSVTIQRTDALIRALTALFPVVAASGPYAPVRPA